MQREGVWFIALALVNGRIYLGVRERRQVDMPFVAVVQESWSRCSDRLDSSDR